MVESQMLAQAIAVGVVTGSGSALAIRWWARDVRERIVKGEMLDDLHNRERNELKGRIAAQEHETRTLRTCYEEIKASISALHRRLDEHRERETEERLTVARELGILTEAVRRLNGSK